MIDITRVGNTSQKRGISYMVLAVDHSLRNAQGIAAGEYLIGYLPPDSIVLNAGAFTVSASPGNVITGVGTTEGGTEILSAIDTTVEGESGTFTGVSATDTGVPVYATLAGPSLSGTAYVYIEYLEVSKHNGELTRVN